VVIGGKQAIRIDPDDAEVHIYLGLAYIWSKDRDSALEQYEILKKLDTEKANELFDEINK
jgi:lipoprotein NlpI